MEVTPSSLDFGSIAKLIDNCAWSRSSRQAMGMVQLFAVVGGHFRCADTWLGQRRKTLHSHNH